MTSTQMLSLGNFHQEVIRCISIEFNNWNDDKKEHIKGSFLQEQQQEEKPEMCIVGTFECVIRKCDKGINNNMNASARRSLIYDPRRG